jgi:hypothetical protein
VLGKTFIKETYRGLIKTWPLIRDDIIIMFLVNEYLNGKLFLRTILVNFLFVVSFSACIVVPINDLSSVNKCEISSDRKTLKIINGFEDTNTYYSISGLILVPISGVVSGAYVAINNIYRIGEEAIVCGKGN